MGETNKELENSGDEHLEGNITKEQAIADIMGLRQYIYLLGANDSEFNEIDKILKDLDDGKIEPINAVQAVAKIEARKQDYH